MGIFDRLRKAFGGSGAPAPMAEAAEQAGMAMNRPFSPGQPIGPFDGYSRHPRVREFVPGHNISARPRSHERISFSTLQGLIDAYDIAQQCIWHRIDAIRAMEWALVPAPGFDGDAGEHIKAGMRIMEKPDGQTGWSSWVAKWLYDILAYDAGCLYRMRTLDGRVSGLRQVDGSTIAPLLDYWGRSPEAPAEAYVQYYQGLPQNWLTRDDLIYEPFRPVPGSAYGKPPIETVLLNANTDLRFQAYFLGRFTEGNIPQAFASAPETWTPDQIQNFQDAWDALMLGNLDVKSQIRWIPGGSKIEWSNEKDFNADFSMHLARKTMAAFHVVPAALGFTETVNRSSGETQADVASNVGDAPLLTYLEQILSGYLQHDRGLPLSFEFDDGREQEDRLKQAQAWQVYINAGMASPDEGREEILGLPADPNRPTPRFIMTGAGPVPLLTVDGSAGKVDAETYGPAIDATEAPMALPAGPKVEKDVTVGITTATGIVGSPLIRDDEDKDDRDQLAKRERAAFRAFAKKRRRTGVWSNFDFRYLDTVTGHRLNDAGRLSVRKAAGEIGVAGLAVRAADTGRILMLQRALTEDDPAAGTWEIPGGHLDQDESPMAACWREWAEETGRVPPPGVLTGTWESGIYRGHVWTVESESLVSIDGRDGVINPDDPDGDQVEAIAWWHPDQLANNPAVRAELAASLPDMMAALNGEQVTKGPKAPPTDWWAWQVEPALVEHYTPLIAQASSLNRQQARALADQYRQQVAQQDEDDGNAKALIAAAILLWMGTHAAISTAGIAAVLADLHAEGMAAGLIAARIRAEDPIDHDWSPGNPEMARWILDQHGMVPPSAEDLTVTAGQIAASRQGDATRAVVALGAAATAAALAEAAMGAASSAGRAETVAWYELVAAVNAGAGPTMRTLGDLRWVLDPFTEHCGGPTDRVVGCIDNADASPRPMGDVWPSGHRYPGWHPRCACALI